MPALHGRFIHDGPLSTAQCPNFVPGASIFGFPSVDTSTLHRTLARKTAPVVDILAPNATSAFVSVALNMPSAVLSGICTWPVCITNSARPAMADVCTWSSFAADAAALLLIFVPCLYFWQVGTQCVGGYHDVSYHTEERCFGGVPKPEDRKNAPCHGEMKKPRNTSMFSAECKMCMNMCVCVCVCIYVCMFVCMCEGICVCLFVCTVAYPDCFSSTRPFVQKQTRRIPHHRGFSTDEIHPVSIHFRAKPGYPSSSQSRLFFVRAWSWSQIN